MFLLWKLWGVEEFTETTMELRCDILPLRQLKNLIIGKEAAVVMTRIIRMSEYMKVIPWHGFCSTCSNSIPILIYCFIHRANALRGQAFSTTLGKNTLGTIMQRKSRKAHLSQVYTCLSVRASTITYLNHARVDTKHICNITKHKSEESSKHYISGSSSAQKRALNEVLHDVIAQKKPTPADECHSGHHVASAVQWAVKLEQRVASHTECSILVSLMFLRFLKSCNPHLYLSWFEFPYRCLN